MKKCLTILLIAFLALSMFVSCDDKIPQQKEDNDSQEFNDDLNIALEPMKKISTLVGVAQNDDERCTFNSEERTLTIDFTNYTNTIDFKDGNGEKEVKAKGKYANSMTPNYMYWQYEDIELIIGEDIYRVDGKLTIEISDVDGVSVTTDTYENFTTALNDKIHTLNFTEKIVLGTNSMEIEINGTLDGRKVNIKETIHKYVVAPSDFYSSNTSTNGASR